MCVRVCEQGGGSTRIRALDSRLDLGFNETVRVKPIRCEVAEEKEAVEASATRSSLTRMGQMFCQLCAAKKDIDCAVAAAAAAAAIHSRMEWPTRRRRRMGRRRRRRRREKKNEERNVSCDQGEDGGYQKSAAAAATPPTLCPIV